MTDAETTGPGVAEGPSRRRRWVTRGLTALGVVLVALVVAVAVWLATPYAVEPAAWDEALARDDVEIAERDGDWWLSPAEGDPDVGVVFYPGARVRPEAYVPTWAPIVAEADVVVAIPEMPLNLAVLDRDRAASLVAAPPVDAAAALDRWHVGGHSMGGAMAASWLGTDPAVAVEGLVLWASFSTGGAGLEAREDLEVLSVAGSRDGLATLEDIEERRDLLPPDADLQTVEGMNHAQFGRYGDQWRDQRPAITDAQAQRELTERVSEHLQR